MMSPTVQLSPLGVILALSFLSAMTYLFLWMFRVPPSLPETVAVAQQSVAALRRILVPVVEAIPSTRAVEIAARLGETQKAELILAFVIEVPLSLALVTQLTEVEARGQAVLDDAARLAAQHGLPVERRLVRHRQAAEGILQVARDEDVDAIILGVGGKRRIIPSDLGRTIGEIMRRASCEVIVDRTPILAEGGQA